MVLRFPNYRGGPLQRGRLNRSIKVLIFAIFGMIICGVFFDIAHNLLSGPTNSDPLGVAAGILEDGGELIFISLYAAAVFGLFFDVASRAAPR